MKQSKNRLEMRVDPETQALLDSLMARTNLTKTSIIKMALKVYASSLKKGHIFTVSIKGDTRNETKIQEEEPKPEEDSRSIEDMFQELDKEFPKKY